MSTYINVTVGDGGLLGRVKGQQQASRFAFAEEQRRKEIEAAKAKAEADKKKDQGRKLDPQPYKRDLTAHRHPSGGLIGVTYETTGDFATSSLTLKVGLPGFSKSVEISGISDPGQRGVNDITLPASGSTTAVEAPPGLHYHDSRFAKPFQAWSGLDVTGSGSPPRLYEGTAAPPLTSQVDTWVPYYTQTSTDKTQVFVLPLAPNACIFVYLHNKLKLFNVFRRVSRRIQRAVNPRAETSTIPQITNMMWYDGQQENLTVFDFDHAETFKSYQAYCVLVSDKRVAVLNTPPGLVTALRRVSPEATPNTKVTTTLSSGGGQYTNYGPPSGRSDYFYTVPTTTQQVDSFSDATWNAGAAYGSVSAANQVLAKQFGMGWLQYSSHGGRFFTPAVYQYLGGAMNLTGATAQNYAAMRSAYYSKAPSRFLAPCVQACNTDDTEFYVTTTQPSTITSAVPAANFTKARGYVVKQGESSSGSVYYCWDWGDKASCKAALLALGFSAGDLAV